MSLLMTVFFENGFSETYFPNIDNRNFPIAIRPFVSGLKEELVLNVQVWDGHWTLGGSPQYSLILKGDSVESADLEDGTVIEGMVTKTDLYFSVKIDQVQKENVSFGKYMLKEDSIFKLEIGSDDLCNIVYKNRFVTGSHAEITFESGAAYITDKNSVNGTFLNGKLVKEKTRLHYGDIIYIVGLKIVYLNNLLAINKPDGQCKIRELKAVEIPHFEEESTEEAEMETVYFLRTPRKMLNLDRETISIEKCPKKQQQKRQPLIFTIGPSFTMVIPIALAAAMTSDGFGAGSICMSLGAAGIGAVWAVVNSAYNKKEEQESESNRVSKYLEYMVRVEEKLKNKAEYNHLVLAEQYPSSGELLKFTTSNTRRLWEKSSTHEDFLSLRLGTGDRPSPNEIEGIKEELGGEHDPLNDQMEELQEKFKTLHQVPVAVSLYDYRLLGVVSGDEEKRNQLMRLLSLQIAALHPYTDVRMCYVFPGRDLEKMEYVRWLPHTFTPDGKLRMIVCDSRAMGDVMYYLSDVIRERLEASENQKNREETEKVLPHYVIFISDISMIEGEPVSKYLLDPPKNAGISVVFSADAIDKLPSHCNTIVQWEEDYRSCYSTLSKFEEQSEIAFDSVTLSEMDVFSRQLSNFKVRENASNAAIPDMLTFLDMYKTSKVEDLDMYHKWLENRTYESMRSMIGQKAGEQPVYLDIHEKYHGPHGLVAGTTGSGKSETLQTYILSLVLNYHPHEVAFILIDYKGGGMAQSFAGLPHTGCICMEGDDEKIQMMMSFSEEELDRRKKLFSQRGMGSYRDYRERYEDVPAVFLVIDNYPAFSDSYEQYESTLIQLSRESASYGIYLILTCNNSGDIRSRILQNITKGIGLQLADRFEYDSVIGMRSEILPDDRTTGRGLIKEWVPLEFQTALPVKASQGESMMLAVREKLKPLTQQSASGARKLGTDLELIDGREFLEQEDFKTLQDSVFVMGAEEGRMQTCDLDRTLCFTVCGSGKTGKTSFLKYTALQMKKKGADVYVFDGCLREIEEFSRKNELDGYMADKEELYHFMEHILLPQLSERNELVYEARQAGTSVKTALSDHKRTILLINSASEFMEAVYSEEFDVSEVLENVFEKGMEHKLHFFMALSPREYEELSGYRAIRQFAGWKQGIHLGGAFDEQGIFEYEVTPSERSRVYPPGAAFAEQEGRAVLFMTPLIKEE